MNAILYPVARNAEEALRKPRGRAAREREAGELAAGAVRFVSEETGPAFPSREAALEAWAGRVDDERPGHGEALAAEDRYCALREVAVGAAAAPLEPSFAKGRRWPNPPRKRPATAFRLSVSYWRIETAQEQEQLALDQARTARRRAEAARLSAGELRALASQPLRPVRPQQPLDIGLFESPAPEAPHILIPDE
ncbi:MAG: hypothetical protein ACHP7N_07880 [Caulobacterales bacterium]